MKGLIALLTAAALLLTPALIEIHERSIVDEPDPTLIDEPEPIDRPSPVWSEPGPHPEPIEN